MGFTVLRSHSIPLGELPPPPPRACFGRDELIEKVVDLAETFTPIALIGAGGIGKTSVALTVLHHSRIKQRFNDNCRFIRCDQFPASHGHFLARLSKVIGAGVENPEDLTPLRPFLSSRSMILVLDNAESILDPQGTDAREIYTIVEELSRLSNICLCITSRISTIPPDCETLNTPTLSMEAARDAFYRIYKNGERSIPIDRILGQLDFHPLSVTLLATVAHHNQWNNDRLVKEWGAHRTRVLRTDHNESLATTIELSLASPMFRELGPDVRDLLGVIAFFPQGINEDNLNWLLPTISNRLSIFDKLCALSLTYRSNGFITMLAPLRDYLCPKEPLSSPLLCATKEHYFHRLSVPVNPGDSGFEGARWITSEDVNVEHLFDVLTSIDTDSVDVWGVCVNFMNHLHWHKPRMVVLGPKIKELPDDHPFKPECLLELSVLLRSAGNHVEEKQLLIHTLTLWRRRRDDGMVARTLRFMSGANLELGLHEEGIQQAKEALGIYKQLNSALGQAQSLHQLAWALYYGGQLNAAEEAVSQITDLSAEDTEFAVCDCHRILSGICHSRGETEKATNHLKMALGIASSSNWDYQLFWIHCQLARLSFDEGKFDDAHADIARARSRAINDPYYTGHAMKLQARFWYEQSRLEEAKSEASCAADVYGRLGATKDMEECRELLQDIEERTNRLVTSGDPDFDGELLETTLLPILVNPPFSARG